MSWETIDCIDRNGLITGYVVEFRGGNGIHIDGEVLNLTFTASGLRPFTNYTFRVAGNTSEGRGPYSDAITIHTNQDGNNPTSSMNSVIYYGGCGCGHLSLEWRLPTSKFSHTCNNLNSVLQY